MESLKEIKCKCGRLARPTLKTCQICADQIKKIKADSAKLGLCVNGDKNSINFNRSKLFCTNCLDKNIEYTAKNKELGFCYTGCGNPLAVNSSSCCIFHLTKIADHASEAIKNGFCGSNDGNLLAPTSKTKCQKCLDRTNKNKKVYRLNNLEADRENSAKRRAKKKDTETENVNYRDIINLFGYTCHICNLSIDKFLSSPHPGSMHLDHVIPLSKGGTHTKNNIKPAHASCNLQKSAKLL